MQRAPFSLQDGMEKKGGGICGGVERSHSHFIAQQVLAASRGSLGRQRANPGAPSPSKAGPCTWRSPSLSH